MNGVDLFGAAPAVAARGSHEPKQQDNGVFAGLPREFGSPDRAAKMIAALNSVAEREALWLRIPEAWRPVIGHFTELAIAARIVEMPSKMERQNALGSVPDLWRENVKQQVLRMWKRRVALESGEATYYREHDAA